MDLFFTLHEDSQSADYLSAPVFCSETIVHTTNPEWQTFGTTRSSSVWLESSCTAFVIVVWDSSVEPMRSILKLRIQLSELMYLATTELELPPNTLFFHLFDGIYVPKETRFELEEHAVVVRYESFTDSTDDFASSQSPQQQSGGPKQSFTRSALVDLVRRKRDVDRLREGVGQLERHIVQKNEQNAAVLATQRAIVEKRESVEQLRQLVTAKREQLQRDRDELKQRSDALLPEAQLLRRAQIALKASAETMEQERQQLQVQQRRLEEAHFFIREHSSWLISQLRDVYRIEKRDDGIFSINNIGLPNSNFTNCDEETIAAGLGHVCHVVHLLSRYLAVPLRYPMRPMQTRSTIEDPISNVGRYPLFSKNQDLTHFEYAVFLLNKNLEQLIHSEGLEIESLRQTLPNLKLLMDSFKPKLEIRTSSFSQAAGPPANG